MNKLSVYVVELTREGWLKADGSYIRRESFLARSTSDAIQMFAFKYQTLINRTEEPLILCYLKD